MKEIPLTGGGVAQVDDADYDRLSRHKWHRLSGGTIGYASRMTAADGGNTRVLMHRELVNAPKDFEVHHVDGNTLNNQKSNLALVTKAEHVAIHATEGRTTLSFSMAARHATAIRRLAQEWKTTKSSVFGRIMDDYLARNGDG